MVRQALRLGLVVTLVVLALSACNGGEKQPQFKPQLLPEEQQELRPGVYRSEEFKPPLLFRVGDGWTNASPEMLDVLGLIWGESAGISFVNAEESYVYDPTKTGTPNLIQAPKDMVGWFQQHPYLRTSNPNPVTVGGAKGVQFDVVVEDLPEDHFSECGSGCVDLFKSSGGLKLGLGEDTKEHEIVLEDVEGETVIIRFGSPATDFDEFAPEARKVIDGVEWGDS